MKQPVKKAKIKAKAKETPKRGRGRPRKEISAAEVQALAGIGCTEEEIAKVKGISVDTLHRNYAEAYEKGFATMQISLRRRQMRAALAGSNVMMIWLGKNLLGQKDRSELTGKDGASLASIVFTMPKNGRDQGGAEAKPLAQAPTAPAAKLAPDELPSTEPPAGPAVAPALPVTPPSPPPLTPAQVAGTPEVDEDRPRPRYSHRGRDPRVAENIHSLKPIGPAGGPAASTGKR